MRSTWGRGRANKRGGVEGKGGGSGASNSIIATVTVRES